MRKLVPALVITALLVACASQPSIDGELQVVATHSILGNVVAAVGEEHIALTVLIPANTDPHAFEPAPRDAASISEAALVFTNGLGLEEFLQPLLDDADESTPVISVSDGIETIEFDGEEHAEGEEVHEHGADPHVWMNPQNVKAWVENIAEALIDEDPQHAEDYRNNANAYLQELDELDEWAMQQVAQLPEDRRQLVTDHDSAGYLAEHYGFEIVGALIPSYSTASEPTAGELADLEQAIAQYGVSTIFVGVSVNPALAERVAADTGVRLVPIYTESLSDLDGPAASYLDLMRYDIETIVGALK
jgi:ABC-type Zn uptake system ZnuABC Zn-binding protein ZnuA